MVATVTGCRAVQDCCGVADHLMHDGGGGADFVNQSYRLAHQHSGDVEILCGNCLLEGADRVC